MTTVTRLYRFAASHRLHAPELSDGENSRLYGKCNNPYGHGHDYILSVSVSGPVDRSTGLLLPLAELDSLVQHAAVRDFSNSNFNLDVPEFRTLTATTENIAEVIAERIQKHWPTFIHRPEIKLTRVHVQETDRNGFELFLREPKPTIANA